MELSFLNCVFVFRVILFCVFCDIFVVRKCCGFKLYVGRLGCYKCFKVFLGDFGEKGIILVLIDSVGSCDLSYYIICMLGR